MPNITTLFKSFQSGFLKNVLSGAGITLATSGSSLVALKALIGRFQDQTGSLSSMALGMMHVIGFDVFISLIFGAMVAKHYQDSAKLFLTKKK